MAVQIREIHRTVLQTCLLKLTNGSLSFPLTQDRRDTNKKLHISATSPATLPQALLVPDGDTKQQ